jgi:cytidylate kinase
MVENRPFIVAIDGPSASGKGTVAQLLAEQFGYDYLDTGALYRILAYHTLQHNIAPDDENAIAKLAVHIDFTQTKGLPIRSEEISSTASQIAVHKKVREVLNKIQKDFPHGKKGVIIDGRDIGTVIFPDADCKFYITASVDERAKRRYNQLQNIGKNVIFDEILQDLRERDKRDSSRKNAPTGIASDAIIIDTTVMPIEEVLKELQLHVTARLKQVVSKSHANAE